MALEILPPGSNQVLEMAVSLDDAKAYLKAIGNGEDATISTMIGAAQSKIEKATDRLLISRSCRFTCDGFGNVVTLPVRPVDAVGIVVKYFDTSGHEQTLAPEQFRLVDRLEKPRILPAPGHHFPATWELPGGVTVEFTAGYGEAPESIPADLRIAVLKTVRDMWSFRGDMATVQVIALPEGVQDIIDDYRRWVV